MLLQRLIEMAVVGALVGVLIVVLPSSTGAENARLQPVKLFGLSCSPSGYCLSATNSVDAKFAVFKRLHWSLIHGPFRPSENQTIGFVGSPIVSCASKASSDRCAIAVDAEVVENNRAVSYVAELATFAKGKWSSLDTVATGGSQSSVPTFGSLSCASNSFCVALSSNGDVYTLSGASWLASKGFDSGGEAVSSPNGGTIVTTGNVVGLSCAPGTGDWCLAMDSSGLTFEYSNDTWTGPVVGPYAAVDSLPSGLSTPGAKYALLMPTALSCVAMNDCLVAGEVNYEETDVYSSSSTSEVTMRASVEYSSTSWGLMTTTNGYAISSLDCEEMNGQIDCAALTALPTLSPIPSNGVIYWNGSAWSSLTASGVTVDLSCISPLQSCLAVGNKPSESSSYYRTSKGVTWSTSLRLTGLRNQTISIVTSTLRFVHGRSPVTFACYSLCNGTMLLKAELPISISANGKAPSTRRRIIVLAKASYAVMGGDWFGHTLELRSTPFGSRILDHLHKSLRATITEAAYNGGVSSRTVVISHIGKRQRARTRRALCRLSRCSKAAKTKIRTEMTP